MRYLLRNSAFVVVYDPLSPPSKACASCRGFLVHHHFILQPTIQAMVTLSQTSSAKVAPADIQGTPAPADLHITPNGRFLYVSERTSNTIAGYRINIENGALALISHTPTETKPRGFAIDPRGRYLLAVGEISNAMTGYAIDQETGVLTPVFHAPMGKDPNWVEILDIP